MLVFKKGLLLEKNIIPDDLKENYRVLCVERPIGNNSVLDGINYTIAKVVDGAIYIVVPGKKGNLDKTYKTGKFVIQPCIKMTSLEEEVEVEEVTEIEDTFQNKKTSFWDKFWKFFGF